MSPRIALFTLESLANAAPVRRFVADHAEEIVCVGLSNAGRPNANGFVGQTWRHLRRSGPGFLPYLAVNFGVFDLICMLDPILRHLRRGPQDATTVPLERLCGTLGIRSFAVDDVNDKTVETVFAETKPDLIVSFHFDQIFSAETLGLARHGGVNVHPSLLPRYRGPVPTIHALAQAEPDFGVTVHRLAERIDTGTILAQAACDLPPNTTASRAAILLHEQGRLLLDRVLAEALYESDLRSDSVEALPYCPFPSPDLLRSVRRRGHRLTSWADAAYACGMTRFSPLRRTAAGPPDRRP